MPIPSGRDSLWRNAAAGWAVLIGLLLVLPLGDDAGGVSTVLGFDHWDKVAHLVLFGVLAGLLLPGLGTSSLRYRGVLAALLSTAYGGALEVVQIPLSYRGAELADFAADAAGAALALALALALACANALRARRRRTSPAPDC